MTAETARALLERHGLPEDVIDGVLCLYGQELAARIRTTDLPDWHVDLDLFDNGVSWAADLVDPTVPDALAGMKLIDTVLATVPLPSRADHAPGKAICCPNCHAKGHWVCMSGGQQPECAASLSGNCLRESQSETACDTEAGECVGGGPGQGQTAADRLLCPHCKEDVTDYAEDDHVFRTGDDRPYCSSDCVIAAHRKGVPTSAEVIHGCPPDGSGLTPCCGRTPFELPLSDRISSEAPTTCPGPEET